MHPGSDADASGTPELQCESRLGADVLAGLVARGHDVREVRATGGPGGPRSVVSVDHDRGVLPGAADPRMDGVALAL